MQEANNVSHTFVVARGDHHHGVAAGLGHGLGHLDRLQRGLAARARQQQLPGPTAGGPITS